MPLTAFGAYDVVAFVRSGNETHELCRQSFFFCPFFRFASVLLVLVAVAALVRHFAVRRLNPAWWVLAPLGFGFVAFMLVPPLSSELGILSVFALAQMVGLSVVLFNLCRCKKRRRFVGGVLTLVLNIVALLVLVRLEIGDMDCGELMILSLLWILPSLLCLLAVRRIFTRWRIAIGTVIGWLVTVAAFTAYAYFRWGYASLGSNILWTILMPVPYLLGFFLLVAFNPWCRAGVIRVFGLNRTGSDPCAVQDYIQERQDCDDSNQPPKP